MAAGEAWTYVVGGGGRGGLGNVARESITRVRERGQMGRGRRMPDGEEEARESSGRKGGLWVPRSQSHSVSGHAHTTRAASAPPRRACHPHPRGPGTEAPLSGHSRVAPQAVFFFSPECTVNIGDHAGGAGAGHQAGPQLGDLR